MQISTKNAIEKLLKKTGHQLAVEDFDDIEDLDRLAEKVSGVSPSERRLLNSPFEVNGLCFYPLTIAKSLWIREKITLWDIPEELIEAYTFWILTIPITEDALSRFEKKSKADRDMRIKARKMNFTYNEISDICDRCMGVRKSSSDSDEKESETAFGGLIACLIREYGQSPDYWLYNVPIEKITELYNQIIIKSVAEESVSRSIKSKSGVAKAPKPTPKLVALRDFRNKVTEIEIKWSGLDG